MLEPEPQAARLGLAGLGPARPGSRLEPEPGTSLTARHLGRLASWVHLGLGDIFKPHLAEVGMFKDDCDHGFTALVKIVEFFLRSGGTCGDLILILLDRRTHFLDRRSVVMFGIEDII